MMVTPVSPSPSRIAAWIGAAPLSAGSSEAWMFSVPSRGKSITDLGSMCPYATTTFTSGVSARSCARNSSPLGFSGWSTGRPSATATVFTADARTAERERPTGLSGCVTTATTSNPSPISARSGAVANSGVPQKSTRTLELLLRMTVPLAVLRRLERRAADEAGILVLLQLPLRERRGALQDAQVVEEQLAVEVVDLVLQAAREQLGRLDLVRVAVEVHRAHDDVLWPLDVRIDVGDREAAFLRLGLARRLEDLGIDDDERLSLDVDHREALGTADLRRRQPDPARVVHRLEHVGHERAQVFRDLPHGHGALPQDRVAEDADVEDAHGLPLTPLSLARSYRPRCARSCPARRPVATRPT